MMLSDPTTVVLGPDPAHRRCRINCYAFQQHALISFNGWQYAAYYSFLQPGPRLEPLYVHLGRRQLPRGAWEFVVFKDYPQTTDDGHNTVQLGICPGDGTIHLSYDHHCDILRYRHSIRGLATDPDQFEWTSALFTQTLDHLPGLPSSHRHFGYVTYPRFESAQDDLLFSCRDGKAGLGNDHLYIYRANMGWFAFVGTPLTGIQSNPYVHGMDYRNKRLHVTWVYRGFVHYEGWDDPSDTKHKQQAGPNGAENNHNICYAYSDDKGYTWKNGAGRVIANLRDGGTITNDSEGIVAFAIPKKSGLTNQEAQAVDQDGGVHVLNRDTMDGGTRPAWKHYYRSPCGTWAQRKLSPVTGNTRGRLAISQAGDLYIILPDSDKSQMRILKSLRGDGYATYVEVWKGRGLTGEPLVDSARLEHENVLSLLVLVETGSDVAPPRKSVAVLDFQLD
ncbi:hypothetical protein VTK26DRAFT_2094 [Humicola hyalothermophila]